MMLKPAYLQKGDRIRIVSPAGRVKEEKILPAVDLLLQEGFEVILGANVFERHFQFAGTEKQRLGDLHEALDDRHCKAIICSRGGYGSIRILEKINLNNFRKFPKWLVGFSDITVLHSLLQKEAFCSVHGAMPGFYLKEGQPSESYAGLMKLLKGEKQSIQFSTHILNRNGSVKASLTGGNLSILYSLSGTPFMPDTDGKILFIEDVSEYLYHLDRMMLNLKISGKLENLAGLLVGSFTEMKDNDSPFGQTVEEIICSAVDEYRYPVCFGFPAGHIGRNLPLMFGAEYELEAGVDQVQLRLL